MINHPSRHLDANGISEDTFQQTTTPCQTDIRLRSIAASLPHPACSSRSLLSGASGVAGARAGDESGPFPLRPTVGVLPGLDRGLGTPSKTLIAASLDAQPRFPGSPCPSTGVFGLQTGLSPVLCCHRRSFVLQKAVVSHCPGPTYDTTARNALY
jgi:hypothetical protein